MRGTFIKHEGAFHPYDEDTESRMKKVHEGEVVTITFKKPRNAAFHRKYFSLINTAWEYLTERQEKLYGSKDGFRKTLQVAAGFYEPVFDFIEERFVKSPSSIAFDKMDEVEFGELYEGVRRVLFTHILKNVSEEEFMSNLVDY